MALFKQAALAILSDGITPSDLGAYYLKHLPASIHVRVKVFIDVSQLM